MGLASDGSRHNRRRPDAETEGKKVNRTRYGCFYFDSRGGLRDNGKRDRSKGRSSSVRSHAESAVRMGKRAVGVEVSRLDQSGYHQEGDAQEPEKKFSSTPRV